MQTFIPEVIQAHFDEASYLFSEFMVEVNSAEPKKQYLKNVSARLSAHLDGLVVNHQAAWLICEGVLSNEDLGDGEASDFFVASYLAFQGNDLEKVKPVVETAESHASLLKAVSYGLAWIPWQQSGFWATKFVASSRLAIASIGLFCHQTYKQPAPITTKSLLAKSLEQGIESVIPSTLLMSEKTQDKSVLPLLQSYQSEELNSTHLQVLEARIKLGDLGAVEKLKPFVMNENDFREHALSTAFSRLDTTESKQWIAELKNTDQAERLLLLAIGAMKEKPLLPWVVKQMHTPEIARIAGKVFSQITGYDLRKQGWIITDGSMDKFWLELDGDEELDWPDVHKIEQATQQLLN